MRTVFLVHVENVDPESVSLVEGAVAQGTGELPVAVVHTARVFQVAVSVVLVGKHFAAPFAREAAGRTCNGKKANQIRTKTRNSKRFRV